MNGVESEEVGMMLGKAGEAYFVVEEISEGDQLVESGSEIDLEN